MTGYQWRSPMPLGHCCAPAIGSPLRGASTTVRSLTYKIGRSDGSVPLASLGPLTESPTLASPVMVRLPVPGEVRERFLEVRETGTGEVVTTLEVLSTSNKRSSQGRQVYEEKRLKILGSQTHLVEIDLI
jgi:hypothetical protein